MARCFGYPSDLGLSCFMEIPNLDLSWFSSMGVPSRSPTLIAGLNSAQSLGWVGYTSVFLSIFGHIYMLLPSFRVNRAAKTAKSCTSHQKYTSTSGSTQSDDNNCQPQSRRLHAITNDRPQLVISANTQPLSPPSVPPPNRTKLNRQNIHFLTRETYSLVRIGHMCLVICHFQTSGGIDLFLEICKWRN